MNNDPDALRGGYKALAVGDMPSVSARFSPSIHWTEAEIGPCGGTCVGPDAIPESVFMKLGGERGMGSL